MDYISEPENKLIRYGPEVVEEIRKENNLDNKLNREQAIAIIDRWVKAQDHLVKKDYRTGGTVPLARVFPVFTPFLVWKNGTAPPVYEEGTIFFLENCQFEIVKVPVYVTSLILKTRAEGTGKAYIERSLVTCKGSLERAKKQIDKICTFRTLMPKYFQTTNVLESEIAPVLDRGLFVLVPTLTDEYHRVIIIRVKPSADIGQNDYTLLFKLFVVVAEYLKNTDYCRGFTLVCDIMDTSAADVLSKLNLVELQQFLPVITEGYGTKIKGIIFLTGSKFIDGFVKIVKPFFSEKIANRIHVASSIEGLKQFLPVDILPEEYGGKEQSTKVLHSNLVKTLSSDSHVELMKEMNKACTDETKRQLDKFNEQYMGMPGTFRTLSLD